MKNKTETIWNTFCCQLKAFILQKISDPVLADDLFQDVFVKIHLKIDTLRDEKKIQSWVYQITRNTIIDYYRKQKIIFEDIDRIPLADSIQEQGPVQEIASGLKEMVKTLPEKYAQALLLVEFEGMSQIDLAKKLDISISGAKSRVQRGRQMLKDMLMQCCHYEFDQFGTIIDYHPHCCCCSEDS